jgi:hypothetical protein
MAFQNLIQDVLGTIPGMNRGLAATRINEAFQRIQNDNVWSFQCITGGWLTPGLLGGSYSGQGQNQSFNAGATFLSPGTITVVPFTTTITGDAVATASWTKTVPYPPLLTQQQIRIPYYSLYNIIALGNNGTVSYLTINTPGSGQTPGIYVVNGTTVPNTLGSGGQAEITVNQDGTVTLPPVVLNTGTGYQLPPVFTLVAGGTSATFTAVMQATLTIDRPWTEPPVTNGSFMIYQAYYPLPANFRRWYGIMDTTNNNAMDYWSYTQLDLANIDAERTVFDEPLYVVPYQIDSRPGSATYGSWLAELWPHPISVLPYTFRCQANWPLLQNPNDTLPPPLTEEIVRQRAYEMCCLWKEGQRGDSMERGSGANWQFLAKAYHEEYTDLLRQLRIVDKNITDLYFTKAQQTPPPGYQDGFATLAGQLNVGVF